MAHRHVILTDEEFARLRDLKMVGIDDLDLDDQEKQTLKAAAKAKLGGGATPFEDPIPRVVCGMVGDEIVCRVVPRS